MHGSPNVSASVCASPVYGVHVIRDTHFQKDLHRRINMQLSYNGDDDGGDDNDQLSS